MNEMTAQPVLPDVTAHLLIDGRWRSDDLPRRAAISPVTGTQIGSFPLATAAEAAQALDAASRAQRAWGATTVFDRIEAFKRVIEVISERGDEIATLIAYEQGKTYASEAQAEIEEVIGHFDEAISGVRTLEGKVVPSAMPNVRNYVYRMPVGVVVAIQPWNFPLGMAAQHVAPALAGGNCVVVLPAPTTTLSAHLFVECLVQAGIPSGVINLVTGDGAVVGEALTRDDRTDVVVFTGSTATGAAIAANAKNRAQILELGGNGPVVVLDDADLDKAAAGVLEASVMNSGQVCTAAELVLVHEDVYDDFAARLKKITEDSVVLGDPFDEATTMGPMNNEPTAAKVDAHVADALAKGATVTAGGARQSGFPTDLYWPATILTGVTGEMRISAEETFGPVMPLRKISSEAEAIAIIDASEYGLASAVFTRDIARGIKFAERASSGMCNVNLSTVWTELHLPFGGGAGKGSGRGRVQGHYALHEVFTELKTVMVDLGE